jgi:hypothetical protein
VTGHQDDTGPIPAPDHPADDLEQKRAERFGELVDSLVTGSKLPPAMDPDDRLHIDVASMIRASTGEVALAPERARELTAQALERAMVGEGPPSISSLPAVDGDQSPGDELAGRRSRLTRIAPWTVAAIAAAAAIALWIARPPAGGVATGPAVTPTKALPSSQRSRPADALIGAISRTDSHLASSRIDVIYADRLDGYRSLALSARAPRGARRD